MGTLNENGIAKLVNLMSASYARINHTHDYVKNITTGSLNGTLKYEIGFDTVDVPVSGLKSAAYTESTEYAAYSHTHNSDEISLVQYVIAAEPSSITTEDNVTTAIGKLEAAINLRSIIGHVHSSSSITSLENYSKPEETSAILVNDTLNEALGKLEKALDTKQNVGNYLYNDEVATDSHMLGGIVANAYALKTDIPVIPTEISSFNNDVGYITGVSWNDVTDKPTNFASTQHEHGTNDVTALTNYIKPDTTSAIEDSDTLNEALGKLETALDTKQDTGDYLTPLSTLDATKLSGTIPKECYTDTIYMHPTISGYKHIPSGGEEGQILRWSADGEAIWGEDYNTQYVHPTTPGNKHIPEGGSEGQILQYSSDGTAAWTGTENFVMIDNKQNISGTKTFIGSKKVAFKQSGTNDKLGFTLYASNDTERGYLEFNPTNTVDGVTGLMTLGNYATSTSALTHIGFRRYSSISGANGAYNLLTPLISNAKEPFNLTTTYTNFYFPLGVTNGSSMVLTNKNGVLDISSLLPTSMSWNNITDKPEDFASAYHTQDSNTITALTDYVKAESVSAIEVTDTLNEALGKLEKAIDGLGIAIDGKQDVGAYLTVASTLNATKLFGTIPAECYTDTVYVHPTTPGNNHIPSGGSAGQILKWAADGTALWDDEYSYVHPTTAGYKHIPSGGSVGQVLKYSEDGTAEWAKEYSYVHPTSPGYKHIPSGGSDGQILKYSADGTAVWDTLVASDIDAAPSDIDTGVMSVSTGSANGTISVDGLDVLVKGLKSGAYVDIEDSNVSVIAISDTDIADAWDNIEPAIYDPSGIAYSSMTVEQATAGTSTTNMVISPKTLADYVTSQMNSLTHNQSSNTISSLTGYEKASTVSALAETDTLNDALGKLEKALDEKLSAAGGTINGNLTIGSDGHIILPSGVELY